MKGAKKDAAKVVSADDGLVGLSSIERLPASESE